MEEAKPTETIANKLDLIKHISEVQSRIKEEITSDFVYARFTEKDKKMIIEMANNAYLTTKRLGINAKKHKEWQWNNQQKQWEQKEMNQHTQQKLIKGVDNLFDIFMTRPMMLAILSRNVKDNYLVKHTAGITEEETGEEIEEEEQNKLKKTLGNIFRNEDTKNK